VKADQASFVCCATDNFGRPIEVRAPAVHLVKLLSEARDKYGDSITEYTPDWARLEHEEVDEQRPAGGARYSGMTLKDMSASRGKRYLPSPVAPDDFVIVVRDKGGPASRAAEQDRTIPATREDAARTQRSPPRYAAVATEVDLTSDSMARIARAPPMVRSSPGLVQYPEHSYKVSVVSFNSDILTMRIARSTCSSSSPSSQLV